MGPGFPFPGGFDIMAPWGRRQATASGYLISNGPEVYGSSKEAFEEKDGEKVVSSVEVTGQ